jgi:hypothetical protein
MTAPTPEINTAAGPKATFEDVEDRGAAEEKGAGSKEKDFMQLGAMVPLGRFERSKRAMRSMPCREPSSA